MYEQVLLHIISAAKAWSYSLPRNSVAKASLESHYLSKTSLNQAFSQMDVQVSLK